MQLAIYIAAGFFGLLLSLVAIVFKFYKASEMDEALVRTGAGGPRVAIQGGLWQFPVIHKLTRVTLRTIKLDVSVSGTARGKGVVRTIDHLPLTLDTEVYAHVPPKEEYILAAARTLGEKADPKAYRTGSRGNVAAGEQGTMLDYEELATLAIKNVIGEKLYSAVRSVAATMTLEELHVNRLKFTDSVASIVEDDLKENGLELESVTIESIDQEPLTEIEKRKGESVFDAGAYQTLRGRVERALTQVNEIEKSENIKRDQQDTEFKKQQLKLEEERKVATAEQDRAVKNAIVLEDANVDMFEADKYRERTEHVEDNQLKANMKLEEVATDFEKFQGQCERDRRMVVAGYETEFETAELNRDQTVEILEESVKQAIQGAAITRVQVVGKQASETKHIVGVAQQQAEQAVAVAEVEAEEARDVRMEERNVAVTSKVKEVEEAKTLTNQSRAEAAAAELSIETAKERESQKAKIIVPAEAKKLAAESLKAAAMTEAEAKQQATIIIPADAAATAAAKIKLRDITVAEAKQESQVIIPAKAEATAAENLRERDITQADADRQSNIARADGDRQSTMARAEGERAAALALGEAASARLEYGRADAEAEKLLNQAAIIGAEAKLLDSENVVKYFLAKRAPELVSAAFKPLESIEGMRVLQVNTGGGGNGQDENGMVNLLKSMTNAAPGGAIINEMLQMGGIDMNVQDLLEILVGNSNAGKSLSSASTLEEE